MRTPSPTQPKLSRRPRFTPAGLMLVVLLVAVGIAVTTYLRKQAEFRRWRDDTLRSSGAMITEARGEVESLGWLAASAPTPCCEPLDPGQLRALAACPHLKDVYLGGWTLTDATLAVLARLPRLESIRSELPRVTDGGMHNLARARHLKASSWIRCRGSPTRPSTPSTT